MQIKTTMRYYIPSRMAKIRRVTRVGTNVEKLEISYITGGNANGRAILENRLAINIHLPYDSVIIF